VTATAGPAHGVVLADPAATDAFGALLAGALATAGPAPLVVYLEGDLGAGKTALVRAVLAALGHPGRVPSPTYTLVEPYAIGARAVLHADLYRLQSPAELDDLGLAESVGPGSLVFVEWPARGGDRLPPPDLTVTLTPAGAGRRARVVAASPAGARVVAALPPAATVRDVPEE
jgi:tRNA threonylcarbamoyladenosine biosynthesis protein TsaE